MPDGTCNPWLLFKLNDKISAVVKAVAAFGSVIFYLTPSPRDCVILSVPHRSPRRQLHFSLSPAITMAGFNRRRRGNANSSFFNLKSSIKKSRLFSSLLDNYQVWFFKKSAAGVPQLLNFEFWF